MIPYKTFNSNLGVPFEESRLLKKSLFGEDPVLWVNNWTFYDKPTNDEDISHLK